MKREADEARKAAAQPMSSGVPSVPIGVRPSTFSLRRGFFSKAVRLISVRIQPGAIALTRTPRPDHGTAKGRNTTIADTGHRGVPYPNNVAQTGTWQMRNSSASGLCDISSHGALKDFTSFL